MIRHLVFFKFKPETTASQQDELLAMLRALPEKISVVHDLEAGKDVVRAARSFDMALVTTFDDLAALEIYAKHPNHLPVVERAREICQQVAAVDFEI